MIINKTKIDWADFTWNPVWGCLNKCSYCYARNIARRFWKEIWKKEYKYYTDSYGGTWPNGRKLKEIKRCLKAFEPVFIESNYEKPFPKKKSIIFINSMSDPMYWEQFWYEKIVKRIAENQQHTFMILTKRPEVYQKYKFPHNTWLGVTITNQKQMNLFADKYFEMDWPDKNNLFFISFEPIQEKIKLYIKPDWVIVGPETGNRKDKYICTPEMLEPFFDLGIPVLMKGVCSKIINRPLRQEWPE